MFGLAWTERLRGWRLVLVALLAMVIGAVAGAPSFPVWPAAGNPDLDKPDSPGVARNGAKLEFTGTVPWVGRHRQSERAGRRVSFGDRPPDEDPPPSSWEHYAPDGVTIHGPTSGTRSFTPVEFERTVKLNYAVIMFVQNLLIAGVFFFVVTMLIRVKKIGLPPFGALRVLARCLVPASILSAVVASFGTKLATALAVCTFLVVLSMNALLFVLRPAPPLPQEPSFDV